MAKLKLLWALGACLCFTQVAAVNLSHTGTGQVLIYPYYSARTLDTLISVTNETTQPKVLKFTVHEADAGLEVLAFSLYLPAGDSWSTLIGSEDGRGFMSTNDRTCTVPSFFTQRDDSLPAGDPRVFFRTFQIEDDPDPDNRAREGYVEIIEMGELTEGGALLTNLRACNTLVNAWIPPNGFWHIDTALAMAPPTGGLSGEAQLFDPLEGTSYRYRAVALDNFSDRQLNSFPGSLEPTLADASRGTTPGKVLGTVATSGGTVDLLWDSGLEAVSAALATASVNAKVVIDETLDAQSELILTLPTRRFFTPELAPEDVSLPLAPFTEDSVVVPYQFANANGDVLADCGSSLLTLPWTTQTIPGGVGILNSRQALTLDRPADESGSLTLATGDSRKTGCDGGFRFSTTRVAAGPERGQEVTVAGLPVLGVRLQRLGNQQISTALGRVSLPPIGDAVPVSTENRVDIEP